MGRKLKEEGEKEREKDRERQSKRERENKVRSARKKIVYLQKICDHLFRKSEIIYQRSSYKKVI